MLDPENPFENFSCTIFRGTLISKRMELCNCFCLQPKNHPNTGKKPQEKSGAPEISLGTTRHGSSSVKTNLGRTFLNIVDKCFPKNHPLHKILATLACQTLRHTAKHSSQITPRPQRNNLTNQLPNKRPMLRWRKMPPNERSLPSNHNNRHNRDL